MKTYSGTAQEIGAAVFIDVVMPVIRMASQNMEPGQLAELYAGFFAGACGSMAADFGKDAAQKMIDAVADQFDSVILEAGAVQ